MIAIMAKDVKVGDVIAAPVYNEDYDRDMHFVGKVLEIDRPHEDITQFYCQLFAHIDGNTGKDYMGMRHERTVMVIRRES